MYLTYLRSS